MSDISFLRRPIRYSFFNATLFLIAANVIVFLITLNSTRAIWFMALIPSQVFQDQSWWRVFTYMFAHGNFSHIFFNMFGLFLFGMQVERRMGSGEFLLFYLLSGIGAGLALLLINAASAATAGTQTVGASGAIFAVMLAFATFFPDQRVLVMGILPMRAPTMVLVYTAAEIIFYVFRLNAGVSHLGHLAGALFGYLLILLRFRVNAIRVFFPRR
jgi:membrane associated rhomboid family serine protease